MNEQKSLLDKVKEGIIKSGFPLEMYIGNILDKYGWEYEIGTLFDDIETRKDRELDITAKLTMSEIEIFLNIQCKKSTKHQLILYAPQNSSIYRHQHLLGVPLLMHHQEYSGVHYQLRELKQFDSNYDMSRAMFVIQGTEITSDNTKYMTAINTMQKYTFDIFAYYLGRRPRALIFNVLVFDGSIFQLSNSSDTELQNDDFSLKETLYGKLLYSNATKNISPNYSFIDIYTHWAERLTVEIIQKNYFQEYLKNIHAVIDNLDFDTDTMTKWRK